MMVGGLDAIAFYEDIWAALPEAEQKKQAEMHEKALNRFKYEVAKGIGKRKKAHLPVYKWHHTDYTCGECGYGANRAQEKYCPNCGTRYREEPRTEYGTKREELYKQISLDEWMRESEGEYVHEGRRQSTAEI